jgi:dynein heavy chain 1
LFKEVRNLQWLGFRVPFSITLLSSSAKQVYPFAVSLKEIIRTYTQTSGKITQEIGPLIASYKKDVQTNLNDGFRLKWESLAKLDPYVRKLSDSVVLLRDKVDDLIVKYGQIRESLDALKKCPLKEESFSGLLSKIQNAVDELNLGNYSNLPFWVDSLDEHVEEILVVRLQEALSSWNEVFKPPKSEDEEKRFKPIRATSAKQLAGSPQQEDNNPKPTLSTSVHELLIRNQVMSLNPPLEHARVNWVSQLHAWLSTYSNVGKSNLYKASFATCQEFRALDTTKVFHIARMILQALQIPSVIW